MSHEPVVTKPWPIFGEKPESPGLYLGLFHGRDDPLEDMDAWGDDGPTIGPLRWVHTTYAFTIRIEFVYEADAIRYFNSNETEQFLTFSGDLIAFGGQFFGDWSAYTVRPEDYKGPTDTFRRNKRGPSPRAHSLCVD